MCSIAAGAGWPVRSIVWLPDRLCLVGGWFENAIGLQAAWIGDLRSLAGGKRRVYWLSGLPGFGLVFVRFWLGELGELGVFAA